MDGSTHEMRLAQWLPIIKECRSSGMTVRSWCREHDVNEKQFHYWQRKIRNEVYQTIQKEDTSPVAFAAVSIPAPSAPDGISHQPGVALRRGGLNIEIANNASEAVFKFVKEVLSYAQ